MSSAGDLYGSDNQPEQNEGESQDAPATETIDAVEAIVVDPNAEDGDSGAETITGDVQGEKSAATPMPVVTNVTSFAPNKPMQKIVNLSNLKLLGKGGGYVKIGNRNVKVTARDFVGLKWCKLIIFSKR